MRAARARLAGNDCPKRSWWKNVVPADRGARKYLLRGDPAYVPRCHPAGPLPATRPGEHARSVLGITATRPRHRGAPVQISDRLPTNRKTVARLHTVPPTAYVGRGKPGWRQPTTVTAETYAAGQRRGALDQTTPPMRS